MFNRDGLFGKKDEPARSDLRPVNVTPGLSGGGAPVRPQPQVQPAEMPRPDLRFAEPPKAPVRVEEPAGSRLIVGPDIKLKGVEITDCDTLVVEGRVEASMDSRVVQIAENGVFSGTVSIDVAEIRGRFEGELTARKQLVIYSTGRVSGRIRYGKIRIEEGGEIAGEVSTLQAPAAPARQPQAQAQPAVAAAPAEPEHAVVHEPLTGRPAVKAPAPLAGGKSSTGVNTV
ncbi:MAG TPA: polymer-forming cytoskeletal protein [Burkholderiales bacterium]|nr:polymer-forming cytoskeletal protein [Burkholderiales bacterium]